MGNLITSIRTDGKNQNKAQQNYVHDLLVLLHECL